MDPSTDETIECLAQAEDLKLDGRHSEALVLLEDILSFDPENIVALEELAENELALHQFERARNAALQAVALHNDSYIGHYILGFLASRDEQWVIAHSELKLANRLNSNNAEILRCLGWVLFQSGEVICGTVTLERALNLDADNPLILCDLGVISLQSEDTAKAHTLFKRTLELDPTNKRAQEGLQSLIVTKRRVKLKIS